MPDDAIKAAVWTFLEKARRVHDKGSFVPFQPTTTKADDAFNALKVVTLNHLDHLDQPLWLPEN